MSRNGYREIARELDDVVDSLDEVLERGKGADEETVRGAIESGMDESMYRDALPLARTLAPKDTGALAASIGVDEKGWEAGRYRASIGSPKEYAPVQEYGTRKKNYPITPKNGEWLRFYWAKKGRTVFRRVVTHPGVEGKYFLRDSVRETQGTRRGRVVTELGETLEDGFGDY
jgi:hypothetical protein